MIEKDFLFDNEYAIPYQFESYNVPVYSDLCSVLREKGLPIYFCEPQLGRSYLDGVIDWMLAIRPEAAEQLANNKAWLIYNYRNEGYPGECHPDFRIFEEIYVGLERLKIDPSRFIFCTSNLIGLEDLKRYCKKHNKKPFYVLSFPFFENVSRSNFISDVGYADTMSYIQMMRTMAEEHATDKIILSLSRVNRPERSIGQYMLYNSKLGKHTTMSHDKVNEEDIHMYVDWYRKKYNMTFNPEHFAEWAKKTPFVVDRDDFDNNWAMHYIPWVETYARTPIQIVNETWQRNWDGASVFLSEKTFKSFLTCHPFVVNGQVGCNKWLRKLGYKLFDDYFDYQFDKVEDFETRYGMLLKGMSKTVKRVSKMNKMERIEWRFKNIDRIKHNFEHAYSCGGSMIAYAGFMKRFEKTLRQ